MQGNDSYRLVVRRGPQPNQTYDLNKDIITLGRDITNDIVINDPEASRHHLRIVRGDSGYSVEDLGSTNGTFVNGQRLEGGMRPLNNGDLLGLGETVTLGYEMVRTQAAGQPAQPSPYQPPAQQPTAQPPVAASPPAAAPSYQPPQPAPQPPQQGYQPPQAVPPASAPAYGAQPPGYEAPPQPGMGYDYGYDPYMVREEQPRSAMRWILIGCVGLSLLCCCALIAGLVIIDGADLWCDIPVFKDVVTPIVFRVGQALGFIASGGAIVCP